MGNQTLIPSQIQSVDSYFYDLKSLLQFKESLGSTTFMKTAKVTLIENEEELARWYTEASLASTQAPSTPMSTVSPSVTSSSPPSGSSGAAVSAAASLPAKQLQQQLALHRARVAALREQQQIVVVKVFPKYDLSIRLDLYGKRVREIKRLITSRFSGNTNCLPFSDLVVTDRAAFLFRQYIKYNLYDRLSTRPFLATVEKKWITFQLLCAVNEIHAVQIVHGDIKFENILVNSFLWLSLADFASYKPVYLSKNHPSSDFNYYFDISRRRTCYLAPERLDEPPNRVEPQEVRADSDPTLYSELVPPDPNDFAASMDIFSVGCVIGELFMERPVFDFAQLLAYKEHKFDPTSDLRAGISDPNVLEMIFSMISLSVEERRTANEYLQEQTERAFPAYFVYLKNYINRFVKVTLTPDDMVNKLRDDLPVLLKYFKLNDKEEVPEGSETTANDAFLILLSLLLSCVRKLKFNASKLVAVDLLQAFSKYLDDAVILDRVLPYYLSILERQHAPVVKARVIHALDDCLAGIVTVDVQNLNIFPELIFDMLESLSRDESFLVRSALAKCIASFGLTSLRYLDSAFTTRRSFVSSDGEQPRQLSSYDKEYEQYQHRVTEIVMHLLTDLGAPGSACNAVKETLIRADIGKLCSFFTRAKTSEFLLPHMITMLNEKTDWQVRAAFFDALCPLLACIGWESVELVRPLLEQGMRDSEEFVIHRTMLTLARCAEMGLLDARQCAHFLSVHVAPLLCHPSLWIRHGAVAFITTTCRLLSAVEVLCGVLPILASYLRATEHLCNYDRADILFSCLKTHVTRPVYDAIAQDGRSDALFLYLTQRSEIRTLTNQNYLPGYVDCADGNVQAFFERLCALGMQEQDEDKLLQMREFLEKTRISRLSSSLHTNAASAVDNMLASAANVTSSKESFERDSDSYALLKDGYINIAKERFQRVNCEYLNARKSTESDVKRESIVSTNDPVSDLNNEWKLMFGRTASTVSPTNDIDNNKTTPKRQTGTRPAASTPSGYFHNPCTSEVERYLDRRKFEYEEQRTRYTRVMLRPRDTVNTSLCATRLSLASTGLSAAPGTSPGVKWAPKGFLLANSQEHTREITQLSRNVDGTYFATCVPEEHTVKIWSTQSLLDGKSGFFKSVFSYDKQTAQHAANSTSESASVSRPACTAFYDKHSLAVLSDDYRFNIIEFNSTRTQYYLYTADKLFRSTSCPRRSAVSRKITFYYLNKMLAVPSSTGVCTSRTCYCATNYPIDMLYIDEASSQWPLAVNNEHEYFRGSTVRGLFCVSTSTGNVTCIDMRTRTKAFEVQRDLSMRGGYVTAMRADPWHTWLALGTSAGGIELYDFRFMLPVRASLLHRTRTSVVRLCSHPTLNSRIVASYQGNNEIAVWDLADAKTATKPEFVFWGVQSVPPLCQTKMSGYYISGLYGCAEDGCSAGLLAASTDMKIRYIDLHEGTQGRDSFLFSSAFNYQRSSSAAASSSSELKAAAVSGLKANNSVEFANSLMSSSVAYENRQIEGTNVLLEIDQYGGGGASNAPTAASPIISNNSPALTHQSYFTHHQDAITDLTVCYNPAYNKNQPLIITSARDGALKIWR